jgi:hypothetical protein
MGRLLVGRRIIGGRFLCHDGGIGYGSDVGGWWLSDVGGR